MNAHGERTYQGKHADMAPLDRWGDTKALIGEAKPGDAGRLATRLELDKTLQPCPFCGAANREDSPYRTLGAKEVWGGNGWQIECGKCAATGPARATMRDSARSWNEAARMAGRENRKQEEKT